MLLHPDYTLQILSDTPYLLPFGAGIASFRHPLKLSPTGAFLWDILKDMKDISEMTQKELAFRLAGAVCSEYQLPALELPDIQKDMCAFLGLLQRYDILIEKEQPEKQPSVFSHLFPLRAMPDEKEPALTISIADMELGLFGQKELFQEELFSFEVPAFQQKTDSSRQLHFYFIQKPYPHPVPKGAPIITHLDMMLSAFKDGYHLRQPSSARISHVFLTKDGSCAYFYLTGPLDDEMRYDVFHMIRLVFSYSAMLRGSFFIHSVSILYREKAWLFSASAGTGKSTHAALWTQLYENEVKNLNGDLNLITIKDGIPMVYGIPWNGTSGIYSTDCAPLGGITFLRRAETDFVTKLPEDRKMLSLLQRLISPNWTEELLTKQIGFSLKLAPKIFMAELNCTPQPSAAKAIRKSIDQWLSA